MSNEWEKLAERLEYEIGFEEVACVFPVYLIKEAIAALRSPRAEPVEVIDAYAMDLVRQYGRTMTNAEIVQRFLPKMTMSAEPSRDAVLEELKRLGVEYEHPSGEGRMTCNEYIDDFLHDDAVRRALKSSPPSDTVEVPKEPTEEMLRAGVKAIHGGAVYRCVTTGGTDTMELDLVTGYRAMLAACKKG